MRKTFFIVVMTILIGGFRAAAQDKILVAGSGNPYIQLVDKQTGKVEWQHALEKGEECNTVALTKEGNVLYSYKKGAKVVTWNHRVVWDYPTPHNTELQSATVLRNGRVLLGICGTPARFVELDRKGKVVNETTLDLKIEKPHSQFRQIFQLRNRNYLIPVMANREVREVSRKGKTVALYKVDGKPFSSLELPDGNLILPCGDNHCYILMERKTGKELKRVSGDELTGVSLLFVAQIQQLRNKHLLICNWNGHTKDRAVDEPQLIEVTEAGAVVWTLDDKKNVGKISAACYLENFRLPDRR